MAKRKINTYPFEIMGVTYQDYQQWCAWNGLKENDRKNKKEFFRKLHKFELIKKDDKLIMLGSLRRD